MENGQSPSEEWQIYIELFHLLREMERIITQSTGMSQTRLEILHELYHAGETSQAELQKHLDVEGTVITRIVKQLEAAGLVTRRPDPHDNRFTLVTLTPQARQQDNYPDNQNFKAEFGKQLLKGFSSEERDQLLILIDHLKENVEEMHGIFGEPDKDG